MMHAQSEALPPLSRWLIALEIGLIVAICLISTRQFQNWDPWVKLTGDEFSYLINSGAIASAIYQKTGSIPLWNPFVKLGEPLLESPFSFVLNPLMSMPLIFGDTLNGSKVVVLLHIVLSGIGGWMLGRVLRLGSAGRYLLGVMMAGNGSVAGLLSGGFYQMALTLSYSPWVLAGLIGTLTLRDRWPVALLVVATALMMFGGTYWFVLPMAITCGLITVFHLRPNSDSKLSMLPGWVLRRLMLAGVLLILFTMVRLLPQIAHTEYIYHPRAILGRTDSLEVVFARYFDPTVRTVPDVPWIFYHYTMPLWFFGGVVALHVLLCRPLYSIFWGRWRVVIPLLLAVLFFSLWAQEQTPFVEWLYESFALFREWRFLARVAGAANPLLITLVAIWFDDLLTVYTASPPPVPSNDVRGRYWLRSSASPVQQMLRTMVLIAICVGGGMAALSSQSNWGRVGGLDKAGLYESPGVAWLRLEQPDKFLAIHTERFYEYFMHWVTLSRASFGNPDYYPKGERSTLGAPAIMPSLPEWAVGIDSAYTFGLEQQGFAPVVGAPTLFNRLSVWRNPAQPTYAFLVRKGHLRGELKPLTRKETIPVSYYHRIESIAVPVAGYPQESVLVVQEVAYPGWEVEIDGRPATLESVGELLGVVLPDAPADGSTINVEFIYRPRELVIGAFSTVLAALLITLYLLRGERPLLRLLPPSLLQPLMDRAQVVGGRVWRVLTDEALLQPKSDED